MTLSKAPLPLKVLFTCFLLTTGMGYLFAVFYLFLMDIEPHRKSGANLSRAVIVKYYGKRETTLLEASLTEGMWEETDATPAQRKEVLTWLRQGAKEDGFPKVQPIFQKNCVSCHSQDGGETPLTNFQEISAFTKLDTGLSIKSLVRVSHIHLFGISFIFMLTSGIFVLSEINARWRALLIALPFIAMWTDVGSWWFTKWEPFFAYTVIVGGLLMGLSLAAQVLIPLWEMWLKKKQ